MSSATKHSVNVTLVRDGCVVSEDLLPSLNQEPLYQHLAALLQGGGDELFWCEEVAAVELHGVEISPGCFVRHWSEGQHACLALVVRMMNLRAEDDPGEGLLWVVLARCPHVPINHSGHFSVSAADWMQFVADEGARETTFVVFEDLRFVLLAQHSMQGQYVFMPM